MLSGRPRPVEVEIPPDVLQNAAEVTLFEPSAAASAGGRDPDLIDRAAQVLGKAKSPIIFAGGGVIGSEAWDELRSWPRRWRRRSS